MNNIARSQKGFTLIEIIAVLVLVGMMAAFVGIGLVQGVQGYVFARENAVTTQKAQAALTRMARELILINNIYTSQSNGIAYTNIVEGDRAVALVGSEVRIKDGTTLPTSVTGDILIDNVNSMTFSYFADRSGTTIWNVGMGMKALALIRIDLVLNRQDSGVAPVSFFTEINPRNNGNLNGPILNVT